MHSSMHGRLLHHRASVHVGKGRRGDIQSSPGDHRPHMAPDQGTSATVYTALQLCQSESLGYFSNAWHITAHRFAVPQMATAARRCSRPRRCSQIGAAVVGCSLVYNTLSIAWHLTFSCSQSSTTFIRYTHSFTVTPDATKRLRQPLRPSCSA
jgi:hypothetical protein